MFSPEKKPVCIIWATYMDREKLMKNSLSQFAWQCAQLKESAIRRVVLRQELNYRSTCRGAGSMAKCLESTLPLLRSLTLRYPDTVSYIVSLLVPTSYFWTLPNN